MSIFEKCLHSTHLPLSPPFCLFNHHFKVFPCQLCIVKEHFFLQKKKKKKKGKEFKSFKSSSLVSDPLKIPAQQIKCLATLLKKI